MINALDESFFKQLDSDARAVKSFLEYQFEIRDFGILQDPMRYAVLNGGKRLRAFLVLSVAKLYGAQQNTALFAAAAIELIHAYSLVHDDLPSMDDDDLRRGLPTVHKKWDEATAVLVGDGLQALAYEILAQIPLDAQIRVELLASLARASGAEGMVVGQALDIAAEKNPSCSIEQITKIQSGKTGALIKWSACAGARIANKPSEAIERYAHHLGLAFQIHDDVLDTTGDEAITGKRLRKDHHAGKATFVSLLGLDGAIARALDEAAKACDAIATLRGADHLIALVKFATTRKR